MVLYHYRATPGEDIISTLKIRVKEKIDKYFFIMITRYPKTVHIIIINPLI